jgi:DNA-binding NtrC family response regulator
MKNRATVLVVEDHPLIRLSALDLVTLAGFEAIGASSADEAIAILEKRSDIHIVFTDIEMPGSMDGLKLAHYVRDRWPPVHLIVVSGRATFNQSDLPANSRFFSKPYDDQTIVDELTRLLAMPQDLKAKHPGALPL